MIITSYYTLYSCWLHAMFNRTFRWSFPAFWCLFANQGWIWELGKARVQLFPSLSSPVLSPCLPYIFLNSNYSCSSLLTQSRQDLSDHPVPDGVKPSFVIFDIRDSGYKAWASECPDVKNYKWRLNPVSHRKIYSYQRVKMCFACRAYSWSIKVLVSAGERVV